MVDEDYFKRYYLENQEILKERSRRYKDENKEKELWRGARDRAKKHNIPFDIDISDIIIPKYCPALGIEIFRNNRKILDSSPSVDRIIPELGYVKGNIAIISWKANKLKSNATWQDLEAISKWLKSLV